VAVQIFFSRLFGLFSGRSQEIMCDISMDECLESSSDDRTPNARLANSAMDDKIKSRNVL